MLCYQLTIILCMLVFILSIIFYNLAYITKVWIGILRTCAMQANICSAHSNATYKFMSLLPPTCVLQILIDPLIMSFYLFISPITLSLWITSPPFSSMTTKGGQEPFAESATSAPKGYFLSTFVSLFYFLKNNSCSNFLNSLYIG
jgi:hypothetical protein